MEYKIIRALGRDKMVEVVNKHIESGWIPSGGVSVLQASVSYEYFQAMMKSK